MTIPRLSQALLPALRNVALPRYERTALRAGLLHIGVGAFHRAHQAVYTDDVLNESGGDWGIIGASLRSSTAETQLAPQDGLYTVNTLSPAATERRVVGAITDVITASTDYGYRRLLAALANPDIHVVTFTVTEKGYCHIAGALDETHADVQHDLAPGAVKHSLPGVIVAGLSARQQAGGVPVTLLSCDNLAGNGHVLRNVVCQYAERAEPGLLNWINANVCFPSSMVDRIVPATTDTDHVQLTDAVGFSDAAMVCSEPFRQWVIETQFAGPRPQWEHAGALLVPDVTPYERAKLRLLNGPHSACAYLGRLKGYTWVHEVVQDPELHRFLVALMTEDIVPTVPALPALDTADYVRTALQRFSNTAVAYGTRQVATDGSQKLPQRLLPVARERLRAGARIDRIALVFAAWIEHYRDPAPDPMSDTLRTLYRTIHDPEQLVAQCLSQLPEIRLQDDIDRAFAFHVSAALRMLRADGLAATVAAYTKPAAINWPD